MSEITVEVRCKRCKRVLIDKLSRDVGMGATCRKEINIAQINAPKQFTLFAERGNYEYGIKKGVIWVKSKGTKSVMQNVKNVLRFLSLKVRKKYNRLLRLPIIFLDSFGCYNKLNVAYGKNYAYKGIKDLKTNDFELAIEYANKLKLL